jgi:hypothetical protein
MYRRVTLIMLATTLCCAPLKEAHTEKHSELTIADSTLTRLLRSELERTMTTLNQTVVEYYPPQPEPAKEPPAQEQKAVATPPPAPRPRGAVKRIVKTEVVNGTERKSDSDSLSHSRINTAARCDEQSSLDESPNTSGSSWLKWCAGCLALILLIIAILKFK